MLTKKQVKELTKLFKIVKRLSEEQAEFEHKYETDPVFRRGINAARVKQRIEKQEAADKDFHNTLEDPEFRVALIQELVICGMSLEAAINRTSTKVKLYKEAHNLHMI